MNVTLTSLEALILKATNESLPCPDPAALEAFCVVMKDATEGPQLAAHALAARIHSPNSREALLALTMLDQCMRRGDANFHAEIGKFRFLNEMIKLVSPKYYADRTAPEVRTRVVQLLHAWSIEYPKESKFKVAYDMLKNQGVIKETPPPLPPEDGPQPRSRTRYTTFEDEEKAKLLQKLLHSKKPEDLQHANRLIKTMVKEEERRSEHESRRDLDVSAALDSAELLMELLANAEHATDAEEQLMSELNISCGALRITLQRLTVTETDEETLGEIFRATFLLDKVLEQYRYVSDIKAKFVKKEKRESGLVSLLDFAGAGGTGDNDSRPSGTVVCKDIDELGDIFSAESESNVVEPLKPVSLMSNDDVDLIADKCDKKPEGWNELDSLGEQLIKQSLPDNAKRLEGFNSKPGKKIPMNALTSPKHEAASNGALLDLDFFNKKPEEAPTLKPSSPVDDVIVDIAEPKPSTSNAQIDSTVENMLDLKLNEAVKLNEDAEKRKNELKPLTDINVSLSSVQPGKVPPMTIFEEDFGLTVVLHFCKDKPRPDVNVIVISTTNTNKVPVKDYSFQGMVPKGCKIRLLSASGDFLPEHNPFSPPPAITQVMLIGRPSSRPQVDLKFIITYFCDDDHCSEIGEVKNLPLDFV